MSRAAYCSLCLFICAILFPAARADVASIHVGALPQEAAILNALDDARLLEPYTRSYTAKWAYPVPKEEVLSRIGKDLGFLKIALQSHPNNPELLLLTGLVAHYAYNMDFEGSYEAAMDALAAAEKRVPADPRPAWFRASLLCQTSQPKQGAEEFLAIEAAYPWERLPAGFWDDYMECATVTSMSAHVLRAANHLEDLHAKNSDLRSLLAGVALKRFTAFDPAKTYEPKEVWSARNGGNFVEFTSTTCGVRFRTAETWKVEDLSIKKGSCVAYFTTEDHKGAKHELTPSVLLMISRPKENETLEQFAARFMTKGKFEPFSPSRCPSDPCIAVKGTQPGMYGKDGDGRGRIIAFERNQPDFPGLLFEAPAEPPKSDSTAGAKYYRPDQVEARIPGKLYYLLVLDTAASIEEFAMRDLDLLVKDLVVE